MAKVTEVSPIYEALRGKLPLVEKPTKNIIKNLLKTINRKAEVSFESLSDSRFEKNRIY